MVEFGPNGPILLARGGFNSESDKEAEGKDQDAGSSMRHSAGLEAVAKKQAMMRSGSSRSIIGGGSQHSRSALATPPDANRGDMSESDKDDGASRCTSTRYCASGQPTTLTTPDKLKGQPLVNYWVARMPLQNILDGIKKVGVPVHQSELAMKRLEPKQQLQLRSHMQCVQWCQVLCVHGIHMATSAQIKTALEGLSDSGLQWPGDLMRHLWGKEFLVKVHRVTNELSKSAVEEFLDCCLPYVVPAAESADFNWRHPRLCDIPFEPQEKSSMFLECVLDKALVELCLQGQDSMEKAKLFSDWVMKVMCFLCKSREPTPMRGNLLKRKKTKKKKKETRRESWRKKMDI